MNYYTSSSRVFFGGPVTRTVKILIVVNVVVFLMLMIERLVGTDYLIYAFGLTPAYVTARFAVWQFATYLFLHADVMHIFFNMLTLFMFGNDLERYWGTRRFLSYYLVTGIGAGICSWLVSMHSPAVIIGASGSIYGLLLAYGLLYPNRIVLFNFLIPVKVKWLVLIMGGIAFFSSLSGTGGPVAHVAHLGGMVVGFAYLRGKDLLGRYYVLRDQRRREALKKKFEVYYGDLRYKIDDERKKGPTIH
jgi:membrane associated rhomboid family serine protease